jgi:hypothetical protein
MTAWHAIARGGHEAIGEDMESWAIYTAEATLEDVVTLDAEHDRYEWVALEVALARCLPARVGNAVGSVARLLGGGEW